MQINIRSLEIRKQKDENFESVTGNLDQIYGATDIMEVPIKHLPLRVDIILMIFERHCWWSLFRDDVDLVFRRNISKTWDRQVRKVRSSGYWALRCKILVVANKGLLLGSDS